MEGANQEINGYQLLLTLGPLMDKYLEKISQFMYERLKKKHLTGLVLGIKLFTPSETFDNMYYAYDCTTHIIYNRAKRPRKQKKERKPKTYYIWMEKLESAEKIFVPWRFDGTNYLVWQNFA